MFDETSRYYRIETTTLTAPDGRVIAYIRRRFLPDPASIITLAEHRVAAGDRLDNLAARYLGDPELFWRLCDANLAMNPAELTAEPGQILRVPLIQGG